jgi:hypothetical protein
MPLVPLAHENARAISVTAEQDEGCGIFGRAVSGIHRSVLERYVISRSSSTVGDPVFALANPCMRVAHCIPTIAPLTTGNSNSERSKTTGIQTAN